MPSVRLARVTAEGMSTRAIAPAVGVSQMQAVRDQHAAEVKHHVSPVPAAEPEPHPLSFAGTAKGSKALILSRTGTYHPEVATKLPPVIRLLARGDLRVPLWDSFFPQC